MLQSDKLSIRASEIRGRLAEIASLEDGAFTPEIRTESDKLTAEIRDVEARYRAAMEAENAEGNHAEVPGDAGEGAETRALMRRAKVTGYLAPAMAGTALQGAEAELNSALEVRAFGGGAMVPWAFLAEAMPAEVRAATTTAQLDGPVRQRPPLERLFGRGILEALGVRLESVPAGRSEWPLLTGAAAPAPATEGEEVAAAAGAYTTQTLKPKRLSGAQEWTINIEAEVGPALERSLRRDLAAAVRAKMSSEALVGSGAGSHNVTGVLTRLGVPTAPTAVATYATFAGMAAAVVDGVHGESEDQVSVLLGVSSYRFGAGVYQAGSGEAGIEGLARRARRVMATSYMPAGNGAAPRDKDQSAVLHIGNDASRGDSIAAVWNGGMELLRDPYSGAAKGQIKLVWNTLWDAYMCLRAGAYKRVAVKLKA